MRFGAFVPKGWRLDLAGLDVDQHWSTMLGVALDIERLGYESLWAHPTQPARNRRDRGSPGVAEELSGQDLKAFFTGWVSESAVPELPPANG